MNAYDFDQIIDRRTPGDLKYAPVEGREDILPLWVADMDFRTPECVERALCEKAQTRVFGYQYPDEEYDQLVSSWYRRRFAWDIHDGWLLRAPGVMFGVAAALRALTKEGDGVLIFEPVYPPFRRIITENRRQAVASQLQMTDGRYTIDFDDVERLATAGQVKAVLFCSPHNPVGRVWSREELLTLCEICRRHHLYLISDEIHSDFIYPGHTHVPIAALSDDIAAMTVTCTAPTKTFNLASIQASHIIVSDPAVRRAVQSQIAAAGYGFINSMAIAATKAVYRDGEEWLADLLHYLDGNRSFLQQAFAGDDRITMSMPEGTYLAWLDCRSFALTDKELNNRFLYDAGVRLNPGFTFGKGGSGYMRLNFACPRATLSQAIERIKTL